MPFSILGNYFKKKIKSFKIAIVSDEQKFLIFFSSLKTFFLYCWWGIVKRCCSTIRRIRQKNLSAHDRGMDKHVVHIYNVILSIKE